ncbi:MAG: MerR family transcriptional regulator [Microlunatus sp.]
MLSIGELAQRTGVSRRMLRHWEEVGLIKPYHVDPRSGHRRYELRQAGRVRAIASLRATGFGLDAISDLLAAGLTEERLVEVLRRRETELLSQVADLSACLQGVQARLGSIEKGHHTIMNTLQLASLPELRFAGRTEEVTDESEIPDAVERLLVSLGIRDSQSDTVVLSYDGNTDPDIITVSAGLIGGQEPCDPSDLVSIVLPGSETAASVTYPSRPASIGDAWIALDSELEKHQLRTTGPYRQTRHPNGTITLAAPTRTLDI